MFRLFNFQELTRPIFSKAAFLLEVKSSYYTDLFNNYRSPFHRTCEQKQSSSFSLSPLSYA